MEKPNASLPPEIFDGESLSHRGLERLTLIGRGGMSLVFKAWQPALHRHVVVKRLKPELSNSPEIVERFRREARILAGFTHPNLVHLYDFVDGPTDAFLVMEFIDGMDVSVALRRVERFPVDVTLAIALNVCRALGEVHDQGIVHRDLKPANMRLTKAGEVKLMDFGIVMDMDGAALTRPGVMVGSPGYLSPEQIMGNAVTAKADIFSLGICLYEMLTGQRPFRAEGERTVFQQIRERHHVPLNEIVPSIPRAVSHIVDRCLKKNPEDRFLSVRDLMLALEEAMSLLHKNADDVIPTFIEKESLLDVKVVATPTRARGTSFTRPGTKNLSLVTRTFAALAVFGLGFALGRISPQSSDQDIKFPSPKNIPISHFRKH